MRLSGPFQIYILLVFSANVTDGFVMECLAKTVRIVPVVAGKGVCECIAFGFEHYSLSVIFIQNLIYGGCAGIGWDEKHSQRWFLRFLHICLVLAGSVVSL